MESFLLFFHLPGLVIGEAVTEVKKRLSLRHKNVFEIQGQDTKTIIVYGK